MENDELKIISEKLSLLIKLLLVQNERYQKMTAAEKISLINYEKFPSEQIASLLDIPIKTVRNTLPQLRKK